MNHRGIKPESIKTGKVYAVSHDCGFNYYYALAVENDKKTTREITWYFFDSKTKYNMPYWRASDCRPKWVIKNI